MERRAHIFVAVLGASNYTYAEARWSEALPEWIGAHVNAFTAIGGVPGAVVCDNLKAGVTATCRYEPGINRTYQDLATHYDTAILPTRPRKPRDKAKVEVGVLIIERYVLARLRNRRFFSLFELNAAIREIVADLNARIMRKLGVSRLELLETVERPALKELPSEPYQYAEWKKCRVAPDYHVEVERHYYSVPSRLIREQVEARITDSTIEIFHKGSRVASHARSERAQSPYDGSRAHAELASSLRRVDAGADDARGQEDRPGDHRPGASRHEGQAASRAGLPRLPRHPAAGARLRHGPGRGRLSARQRHRRHHLRLDRLDPEERARQSLRTRTDAGDPADPARQHPRHRLLPLKGRCQGMEQSGGRRKERKATVTSSQFRNAARPSSPQNFDRAFSAAKSVRVSVKPRAAQSAARRVRYCGMWKRKLIASSWSWIVAMSRFDGRRDAALGQFDHVVDRRHRARCRTPCPAETRSAGSQRRTP